ncbi:MAG TPA: hypothetical protein VK488_11830 [Gaiellaceae bacterium]|nr:hypothetical protein [Gaiellaceae bacterium]
MKASYAVTWQEGAGPVRHGKLELRTGSFVLEGSSCSGSAQRRDIAYHDLTSAQITRVSRERLTGRPTLVVDRRGATPLRIAGVGQPGIISELAESLTVLRHAGVERAMSRLVIVVPLQQGKRETARVLLGDGPPFDPDTAGLERHHVFLTDDEAVFVFEADDLGAVERLASDPTLWEAIAGWNELVAGPPRMAEDVYSWIRPHPSEEISFAATPGPGDSEGGDVFAP